MTPSSKRLRPKDDDDDSDDDFLSEMKPTFARSSRSTAEAKKARKDEEHKRFANSLLKCGEQKLEQQTRIDEAHQRSNAISSPALTGCQNEPGTNENENTDISIAKTLFRQTSPSTIASTMDIRATMCLGSRKTLNLERVIQNSETVSHNPSMACAWSSLDVAHTEFRGVLLWEKKMSRQKKGKPPMSNLVGTLSDQILENTSSNSDFATFLRQQWLCHQQQARIQKLPVNLLHFLFAMACAPIATLLPASKAADIRTVTLDSELLSAKMGAYNTLCGLWKSRLGRPCERTHVLTLKALSDQLRDWFGSSLPEGTDNVKQSSNDSVKPSQLLIVASTSRSTLVRFLHLWELAIHDDLVQIFPKKISDDGMKLQLENIANAVVALLWAALDPAFGSSNSSSDDGHQSVQRIISHLLETVRETVAFQESYQTWIRNLSFKIYQMWSTQLGGGNEGTDVKGDKRAWLAVARTVQCLASNDTTRSCNDLQLELMHCAVLCAFDLFRNEAVQSNAREGENDWLAQAMSKKLAEWDVPLDSRAKICWMAISMVGVTMEKLSSCFPDNDPAKCLAFTQCCVIAISIGVSDLFQQTDTVRQLLEPTIASLGNDSRPSRAKDALCCALGQLEENADHLSSLCRSRSMQNQCFPRSSFVVECLKSYARLLNGQLAPGIKESEKKQKTMDHFFKTSQTQS